MSTYALALDVGGTFTDVMLMQRQSGQIWITKTPSTPADPSQGFFAGVQKILQHSGIEAPDIRFIFHGSTVATNAILEGTGAITGMITTAGFQYVLEIGRHDIPRRANLYAWIKPKRPVPPRRILEVKERVLLDGTIAMPLDEAACRQAACRLRDMGVEAIAIVFLHAYANPTHEQQAAAIVQDVCPDVQTSMSSAVLPVFREYERAMATVLNASLQPLVGRYIGKLETGLRDQNLSAPLLIMQSNGGVCGPQTASQQPVHLALSGPAAGAIGASAIGRLTDHPNAISIDMGGTSADICLIQDGRPSMTHEGEIGEFPLQVPMTDIHAIGAGGGSIATATGLGNLTVGPQSAGAVPGPACYDRGGTAPTVTDANLVLGRIPPYLLGGEVPLNPERACQAIHDHIAVPLKLDLYEAAIGILQIVNNNMMGALRVVSVEKGYDPRDFALIAFGGAGPLHAGQLAELLGTSNVIIPPHPGILSALGLLSTDLQHDAVRTFLQRGPTYDLAGIETVYQVLQEEATGYLTAEGVSVGQQTFQRLADLRYAKQGFEVTVDFLATEVTTATVTQLINAFHQRHEQLYTYAATDTPVEIVNLRLRAVGQMDKLSLPRIAALAETCTPPPEHTRQVYFSTTGFVETPVLARLALRAGHVIDGPAIVEQLDTTTVIYPGHQVVVDAYGNLLMHHSRR
ncbi:MAG: hydantoinase/oxoprolinase family protein [bacterium]|nr:hydantoinase/oxoprolinase family protein [bacterium]